MRPTIEDLKVEKTFYKRDRNALGNRTREPYKKAVKRKVNVVTGWTRFGHYIIDAIILGVISALLEAFIVLPDFDFGFYVTVNNTRFGPSFVNMFILVLYYTTCEATMQRTIGKFATNSVVIDQYAEAPGIETIVGRSFSRLVPFEAFSCLSDRGWHDKWSKTYVVSTKERDTLKRLISEHDGFVMNNSEDLLD